MNFKQALIAHLQGERVEAFRTSTNRWVCFGQCFDELSLGFLMSMKHGNEKYRIAPRTILCNGVEVASGESVAPRNGAFYWVPSLEKNELCMRFEWNCGDSVDTRMLSLGLVYLRKEDAIARAKAMLITTQGE